MLKVATSRDDVAAEVDGVWIDYEDDSRLLIARMGNPRNRKAYDRALAKYRSRARKKDLTPDQNIEVMAKCLSESILLDWEGVFDMQGNALEYSREMAYRALRHDIDLRTFVLDQADLAENYRQEELEESAGKSQGGSGGKSNTGSGKT